jgi:ribosomal RNA-processing protein 12
MGLRTLLRSTNQVVNSSAPPSTLYETFGISQDEGQKALLFLRGLAGNVLAVLFNVFGSVGEAGRGLVGEVIGEWVAIAEPKEIEATYNKVTTLLAQNLPSPSNRPSGSTGNAASGVAPVSHTMLDLCVIILPHLSTTTSQALFDLALGANLMQSQDVGVQKRTFRILGRLVAGGKVFEPPVSKDEMLQKVVTRLAESTDEVLPGAKRVSTASSSSLARSLVNLPFCFTGPSSTAYIHHSLSRPNASAFHSLPTSRSCPFYKRSERKG